MMEGSTSNCNTDITKQIQSSIYAIDSHYQDIIAKMKEVEDELDKMQVKAKLKKLEDELAKVLAEKASKEAKRIALMDAIASTKVRVVNLITSIIEVRK